LFVKALKQNLRIKFFIGTSANALPIQIWTALDTIEQFITFGLVGRGTREVPVVIFLNGKGDGQQALKGLLVGS
jgi:hypothetical protein